MHICQDDRIRTPLDPTNLIQKVLTRLVLLELDIICLQKVDLPIVEATLAELEFERISTPTVRVGGGNPVDSIRASEVGIKKNDGRPNRHLETDVAAVVSLLK